MAKILLGVTGGIAAYKALELIRLATASGHSVRVIQTPASKRFVGPASFEALTGAPVLVGEHDHDPLRGAFPGDPADAHDPITHLALAGRADLFLVAPASANTIAKLAHGLADNLLTSSALAARCPLALAPAMNNLMYEHPATQANIATLRSRGVEVIEPGEGRLASRDERGIGRLPEPQQLLQECERLLRAQPRPWEGMRVLITAGGTREPIDDVRFVGNRSSGKMGLALAEAALARGAEVTLIAANVALPAPAGLTWIDASTAAQMQHACEQQLQRCEVLLMAAAVADFRPARSFDGKIKKQQQQQSGLTLELEPTADILAGIAATRSEAQTIVGFAAEHGEHAVQMAREKLRAKQLDAIVVNDISKPGIGFESDANEVSILTAQWDQPVPRASKRAIAESILDAVARLRAERGERL